MILPQQRTLFHHCMTGKKAGGSVLIPGLFRLLLIALHLFNNNCHKQCSPAARNNNRHLIGFHSLCRKHLQTTVFEVSFRITKQNRSRISGRHTVGTSGGRESEQLLVACVCSVEEEEEEDRRQREKKNCVTYSEHIFNICFLILRRSLQHAFYF